MPSYDYPFNERIRTLLRIEDLFLRVLHHVEGTTQFSHHCALISMFQILDVIDRAELKTDLLQELDRQKIVMRNLRGNPTISEDLLNEVIAEIVATASLRHSAWRKVGLVFSTELIFFPLRWQES